MEYATKGRRHKRLPLFEPPRSLLAGDAPGAPPHGLLFLRRAVAEGKETPPLLGATLERLERELADRLRDEAAAPSAARRLRVRDDVLREAGATNYDRIEREFRALARRLGWPAAAALKDLRHLFATALANAAMPEPYRQYLMGHAPSSGGAAITTYTHLNQARAQYLAAIERELSPLLAVLRRRTARQMLPSPPAVQPPSPAFRTETERGDQARPAA